MGGHEPEGEGADPFEEGPLGGLPGVEARAERVEPLAELGAELRIHVLGVLELPCELEQRLVELLGRVGQRASSSGEASAGGVRGVPPLGRDAQADQNFGATSVPAGRWMVFGSRYARRPSGPSSRPTPDDLKPPNGAENSMPKPFTP